LLASIFSSVNTCDIFTVVSGSLLDVKIKHYILYNKCPAL
jgi:hypothetical protein